MDPNTFFELLNLTLVAAGRSPLADDSPHRAVIRVLPTDRVLQILAGPGSGKTEALVWRVLYELFVLGTAAGRMVVTTFTRRAATELEVRVVERADEFIRIGKTRGLALRDPQVHNLRIGTIHSLCDSLLAEFDAAYMEAGTQLVDEAETVIRLARVFRYELGYTSPPNTPRVVNRLLDAAALVALFCPPWDDGRWPSRTMEIVDYLTALIAQQTETWLPRCASSGLRNGIETSCGLTNLTADLEKIRGRWEGYLAKQNILDFAGIQKTFWERQASVIGQFDHVFVDEFQDSNPIQFAIHTRWLEGGKSRLTVVGDDDQSVYRFRGSDIECFRALGPHCAAKLVPYRSETLGTNYRSTRNIVAFTEAFRNSSVLQGLSMPKKVIASPAAPAGATVRLVSGAWAEVCAATAQEIEQIVAAPRSEEEPAPSVALLLFSTSERESRSWNSPALALRRAIENRGLRVYNPRNKMAGTPESPVSMLLGLISYLIDPVSLAPVGRGGRQIEVWASNSESQKAAAAVTVPPPFRINARHAALQKAFIKGDGGRIGAPAASRADLCRFVTTVRRELTKLPPTSRGRLTLAGFVARLLAHPLFRNSGFTVDLFRQALFTQLLEANIAPTRLTKDPLDQPLEVSLSGRKFKWPDRYWTLLSVFGGYLEDRSLDDLEVDAFETDAVLLITFHQAKGLEFDYVYVAGAGRNVDLGPALRTRLFSGISVKYSFAGGLQTRNAETQQLALADRDREVYVALTRAKKRLTVLRDPVGGLFMQDNSAIGSIFNIIRSKRHPLNPKLTVREFSYE